jgi:hypothetical protein
MITAESMTVRSDIHTLINFVWKYKNCLSSTGSQSLYLFTKSVIKQIVAVIEAYRCYQPCTELFQSCSARVNSVRRENYWISSV